MPSLKDLKNRISSVKSTRKITSAMKMVAASKLRRAQEHAEAARPFAERMTRMIDTLSAKLVIKDTTPKLIAGTGKNDGVLLVVVTSDRGLCGAFNGSVIREARRTVRQLEADGKKVSIICVGRKGRDLLRREYTEKIVMAVEVVSKKTVSFAVAESVAAKMIELFDAGEYDFAHIAYNRFKSVISQVTTLKQVVPVEVLADNGVLKNVENVAMPVVDFEPAEEQILAELLPRNLAVQVYAAMLESAAGEQAARMTAMDNATRNAGDMINKLTLNYNRSRQAYITKELIEIISGAEAV